MNTEYQHDRLREMKKFLPTLLLLILLPAIALAAAGPVLAQSSDTSCAGGLIDKAAATAICAVDPAKNAFPDPEACQQFACYILAGFQKKSTPSPWYSQTPQEFSAKVLGGDPNEIFGERYTYAQINWIINSLITMMNPVAGAQKPEDVFQFFDTIRKFLSYNPASPPTAADYTRLGVFGLIGQAIEYPYSHPIASGIQETKTLASKILDIGVQPAYAQGVGFTKLGQGNVKNLWTATRNISYLVAIILLIASGFLVMFRTQIAPQTVVTVQMIIPKLVISLVLITFSYAIVGFVIDMIYVTIIAFLGLLSITSGPSLYAPGGLATAINTLVAGDFRFVVTFLGGYIFWAIFFLVILVVVPIVLSFIPTISAGLVIVPILGLIFGIFAWSIYVWARIFGQILLAYLNLILLTIAGPLQIMMDIIPSKENHFLKWLKCVIGNASVFVSYAIISIIANALFGLGPRNLLGFDLSVSKLIPGFKIPLAADFGNLAFGFLLQMGFFTAVPNIVAGIRDLFCKGEDYSKSIEAIVKDTVGQISKAGSSAGESYTKGSETASKARSGQASGGQQGAGIGP